jgi:hypothetical protein
MGVLTNLIGMAQQQEDARRKQEMDRYTAIAQAPNLRPEIQEWAIDQLVGMAPKKSGLKDVGSMFKQLIAGKRGGDQPGASSFQQALQSTGRPGMTAQVPQGQEVAPTSLPGGGGGPGGAPAAPPTEFGGGSLANVLPGGGEQVPGVRPSLMLSPQEQLNLKLDEFRQTEKLRNELTSQFQDFMEERKLEAQKKQDEQTLTEVNRRIGLFEPVYGRKDAVNMAYTSMNLTPPMRETASSVPGLVLGSDPELQAWGKANNIPVDSAKQYHVMRDASGKITNALEGPATGGRGGFKGTLGELADAQAVIAEGVGGPHKYTASDVKAAQDFVTKYNRPPTSILTFQEQKEDTKNIAQAIREHRQPPILTGMGMRGAAALRAELARPGPNGEPPYNLTQGMEDWQATTRYISTLNGQQQQRLRQATDFAFKSLDLIDNPMDPGNDLIGQVRRFVPRSQFPVINQAALNAAKNGLFGEAAASAARQLDSQITDLQSELATVYKGGNSPTDVGLAQASKMLSGSWSEKTLRDAIDLSRKNLQYRLNSIQNSGPQTATGEPNPYYTAPAQTPVDTTPINRAAAAELPNPPRKGAAIGAADLQKYLDANGGDIAKTRKAVTDKGWVIPK